MPILAAYAPRQQTFDADVLVEIGPLNSVAISQQRTILALCGRCVQQSWIPGQGNAKLAAGDKVNNQIIFSDGDSPCCRFGFKVQSTHAMPPLDSIHVRQLAGQFYSMKSLQLLALR